MARYYPKGSGNNRTPKKDEPNPVLDPGIDDSVNLEENFFSEWLYGEWDEEKLKQFAILYHIPGIRDYIDYLLDIRSDQEYMDRYGLTPGDVHDPRKLRSTDSFGRFVTHSLEWVSDNVRFLYK